MVCVPLTLFVQFEYLDPVVELSPCVCLSPMTAVRVSPDSHACLCDLICPVPVMKAVVPLAGLSLPSLAGQGGERERRGLVNFITVLIPTYGRPDKMPHSIGLHSLRCD